MPTRREFVFTVGAVATGFMLPRAAQARRLVPRAPRQFADVPLKATLLRDNIWSITEGGGNSLLVLTTEGAILTDTKLADRGEELLAKVAELAKGSPRTVINTHHHFDHTGGNFIFNADASTKIIGHKNLASRLATHLNDMVKPNLSGRATQLKAEGKIAEAEKVVALMDRLTADEFNPDQDYDGAMILDQGGVKATLRHFGNGHTDNDTVVHFTDLNILVMGDLVFNAMHPFIDRPAGATTVGWRKSLNEAIKLCDDQTLVIPGHGENGDKSILTNQIHYFDTLQTIVEKAMKEGKSKETISEMKPEPFAKHGFEMLQAGALTAMYDELSEGTN
jgi:cyclase